MNHSSRWGLMLILVLVLALTACTRTQDDVLAEDPEAQPTAEGSSLFGAPEGEAEGDAAAEAAAVEEQPAAEGEAPAPEGEAPAPEGEAPAPEGEQAAEAAAVDTTGEGEASPDPQATTIAIDAVTTEESGDGGAAPDAGGDVYTVAEGDTLLSIAESNSTSVDELRALNNLTSNFIYVGQELKVPSQGQVVQTNDASGDAEAQTTSETQEGQGDTATEGEATTEAPAESASTTTDGSGNIIHVVKADEWVYKIARLYEGVSPQDILDANNLTNADVVVPGQELIIPVK